IIFFFFQAEDGIRDLYVTGVQTCALPIFRCAGNGARPRDGAQKIRAQTMVGTDRTRSPAGQPGFPALVWRCAFAALKTHERTPRSEERRVGKEWRSRCGAYG